MDNGTKGTKEPKATNPNQFFSKPIEGGKTPPPKANKRPASELGARPQSANTIQASQGEILDVGQEDIDLIMSDSLESVEKKPVKKRGRRGGGKRAITEKQKIEIVQAYLDGKTVPELAEQYEISTNYVYVVLNDDQMRDVRKAYQQSQINAITSAFHKKSKKLQEMIETYLDQATDPDRVASTSLPSLFTVMGIAIDKQIALEKLSLQKQELEMKREAEESAAKNNEGLLGEFADLLKSASNIDQKVVNPDDDGEETPYESES